MELCVYIDAASEDYMNALLEQFSAEHPEVKVITKDYSDMIIPEYREKLSGAPYFMSEAINECKGDYYRAIVNTRNTNNDLTYFLGYIMETSIKYSLVYKNVE